MIALGINTSQKSFSNLKTEVFIFAYAFWGLALFANKIVIYSVIQANRDVPRNKVISVQSGQIAAGHSQKSLPLIGRGHLLITDGRLIEAN